jgi:hypothetical protein
MCVLKIVIVGSLYCCIDVVVVHVVRGDQKGGILIPVVVIPVFEFQYGTIICVSYFFKFIFIVFLFLEMAENFEKVPDKRSELSTSENVPTVSVYSLIQVFENLVLLGLTYLENWDSTLSKLKINANIASNGELFGLFLILNQVFQALSSKLYLSVHSQDKLLLVEKNDMTF